MWILFRVFLATIGFVVRQVSRRRRPRDREKHVVEGKPHFVHIDGTKKAITSFTIGMPRRSPTWIHMHGENALDRFCKRLRLAREIQTGDAAFDERVYVSCDHMHIETVLVESQPLRDAIRKVFENGYRRVVFDGAMVWLERRSRVAPSDDDIQLLADVHAASERLEAGLPSRRASAFVRRAFFFEGLALSMFCYAIGASIELWLSDQDHHLFPSQIVRIGLLAGPAIFVAFVAAVVLLMRGSSRGHRVIVESAVLLALGVLPTGIQIVADTNRLLDEDPPVLVTRRAIHCEHRKHTSLVRHHVYHTHYLWLAHPIVPGEPELPPDIEISSEMCRNIHAGTEVQFEIGPGRWGIPWYRRITAGSETWRAF